MVRETIVEITSNRGRQPRNLNTYLTKVLSLLAKSKKLEARDVNPAITAIPGSGASIFSYAEKMGLIQRVPNEAYLTYSITPQGIAFLKRAEAKQLEEQMAHNNGLNTVAQGGKEGSLEEVAGDRAQEAKAKLSELIKNLETLERNYITSFGSSGQPYNSPEVQRVRRTEASRLRVILKQLNAILQLL